MEQPEPPMLEQVVFWRGRDIRTMTAPELCDVIRTLAPLSYLLKVTKL